MFGAFGAGVSLAIAASIALLVVSSVVAFRGWPGDATAPRDPEVAQLAATRAEAKRAAVTEIVSLPKAIVHRPSRAATKHRTGTTHVDAQTAQGQAAVATQPTSSAASQASSTSSHTEASSPAPSSNVIRPVTDAVRDTTKSVADTVAPAAPAVSGALESVGAAGADAVDKVGQAADDAVHSVLP